MARTGNSNLRANRTPDYFNERRPSPKDIIVKLSKVKTKKEY